MNVLSIIQELNLQYKEHRNYYSIPCPNQSSHPGGIDNNPSCNIDKDEGVFHCFTCHYSGHISKLYKDLTGNRLHFDTVYYNRNKQTKNKKGHIQLLAGYERSVYSNSDIMSYLQSIGIYKKQFIDKYGLKYVTYAEYGQKKEEGYYTKFINRLCFPIQRNGELINLEGRDFTKTSKVKVLYPKNAISDYIYNIENINPNEEVIIVEGIKDFCKVWNVHKNTISLFGGQLTYNKIQLLRQKHINKITLFIDNDKAGFNMAEQFEDMWSEDFKICIPDKENTDPNDLSLDEIYAKLDSAIDYGNYLNNMIYGRI